MLHIISSFSMSEKFFFFLSILNDNLAGQSILGFRVFPFRTLYMAALTVWFAKFVSRSQLIDLRGFF